VGKYLDILRRAETGGYDKNDKNDKSPPFGRLCRLCRTRLAQKPPFRGPPTGVYFLSLHKAGTQE
jgi:hypothetical protein